MPPGFSKSTNPMFPVSDVEQARRFATLDRLTLFGFGQRYTASMIEWILKAIDKPTTPPTHRPYMLRCAAGVAAAFTSNCLEFGGTRNVPFWRDRTYVLYEEAFIEQERRIAEQPAGSHARDLATVELADWECDFADDVMRLGLPYEQAAALAAEYLERAAGRLAGVAEHSRGPMRSDVCLRRAVVLANAAQRLGGYGQGSPEADALMLAAVAAADEAAAEYAVAPDADPVDAKQLKAVVRCQLVRAFAMTLRETVTGLPDPARGTAADPGIALSAVEADVLAHGRCTPEQVARVRAEIGAKIVNREFRAGEGERLASSARSINCARIVIGGVGLTSGAALVAEPFLSEYIKDGGQHGFMERTFAGAFSGRQTPAEMIAEVQAAGPGARGIISIRTAEGPGHVVNIENIAGHVVLVDYQGGTVPRMTADGEHLKGYRFEGYKLLLTHDPRRPETMLSGFEEGQRLAAVTVELGGLVADSVKKGVGESLIITGPKPPVAEPVAAELGR